MFDFDPRDSDAREDDRFDFERGRGSASMTTIEMTTGGNPTSVRATTTTLANWVEGLVAIRGNRPTTNMGMIPETTRAGTSGIAIRASGRSIRAACSRATSTCRADWSERSSAIASTRCAGPNRERLPRLARFGWSPVVIFAIRTIIQRIRAGESTLTILGLPAEED